MARKLQVVLARRGTTCPTSPTGSRLQLEFDSGVRDAIGSRSTNASPRCCANRAGRRSVWAATDLRTAPDRPAALHAARLLCLRPRGRSGRRRADPGAGRVGGLRRGALRAALCRCVCRWRRLAGVARRRLPRRRWTGASQRGGVGHAACASGLNSSRMPRTRAPMSPSNRFSAARAFAPGCALGVPEACALLERAGFRVAQIQNDRHAAKSLRRKRSSRAAGTFQA